MDADFAPIEESIKALLVDIVRRCQSTVVQIYNRIKSSTNLTMPQRNTDPALGRAIETDHQTDVTSKDDISFLQSAFEEPPYQDSSVLATWASTSTSASATTGPVESDQPVLNLHSDSGYGTLLNDLECQCSESQESVSAFDGFCATCGLKTTFIWSLEDPMWTNHNQS